MLNGHSGVAFGLKAEDYTPCSEAESFHFSVVFNGSYHWSNLQYQFGSLQLEEPFLR